MKSILFLLYFIYPLALILNSCISCEQLSTVFVLETSDSSSNNDENSSGLAPKIVIQPESKPVRKEQQQQQSEDQNTHIITDDGPSSPPTTSRRPHNTHHQPDSQVVVVKHHSSTDSSSKPHSTTNEQSHQQPANHHSGTEKYQQSPSVRRIEEESQLNHQRVATRNVNNQPKHRASSTTTTTTEAPYTTTPKTEERLLISITNNDDDDYYKPPAKQISGGSINQAEELQPVPTQHQQQQQHKRKPSITISIQDANLKQNGVSGGSSGTPAVILRPSENGQSIVISTIESNLGNSGNKYVGQNSKPSIAIVSSETPHREPVLSNNNHHQNVNNQHQSHYTSTSTHRPPVVNDYNSNAQSNRPIVSTLLDPQRPPLNQITEERPQQPVVVQPNDDVIYEQRPTSRPVNKPVQDTTGYNPVNNNNNNNEQSEYSQPTRPSNQQQQQEQPPKYPLNEKNCGLVHETRIVGGDEADPDDFMWMAAIIKSKPKDGDVKPFCGGSLITRRHILTAAHCLEGLAPRDVLVRLGSYDFDDSTASSLSADFAIDQFRVPGQYSKKTHVADIAIIRLKTPLSTNDNYKTVCMPQPRRSYVGVLGTVTGYGSQSQTFRKAAPKLRQVTVPIWENRKCSVVYKKNLTESFLCAGYEEGGKDACQGDSGGPLMTEGSNERMMIVGVVSHGIGCGSPGYPGVYTRTTTYLDWIEKNTKE